MTNDVHTIRIGYGLGSLRFGTSQEDVRLYLGGPEDVDEELQCTSPLITWRYLKLGINAYFSEDDDYLLGTLRTGSKESELFGARLVGLSEGQVRLHLQGFDL